MLRSRDPDHFAQELLCGNLEENLHLVALVVLHPIDQRGNDQVPGFEAGRVVLPGPGSGRTAGPRFRPLRSTSAFRNRWIRSSSSGRISTGSSGKVPVRKPGWFRPPASGESCCLYLYRFEFTASSCDQQPFPMNEGIRDLLPCALINRRKILS